MKIFSKIAYALLFSVLTYGCTKQNEELVTEPVKQEKDYSVYLIDEYETGREIAGRNESYATNIITQRGWHYVKHEDYSYFYNKTYGNYMLVLDITDFDSQKCSWDTVVDFASFENQLPNNIKSATTFLNYVGQHFVCGGIDFYFTSAKVGLMGYNSFSSAISAINEESFHTVTFCWDPKEPIPRRGNYGRFYFHCTGEKNYSEMHFSGF